MGKIKAVMLAPFRFLVSPQMRILISMFFIGILTYTLAYSLKYYVSHFPNLRPLQDKMFYVSVGVAIVTSLGLWIEGRIKVIIKSFNSISKKREVKNA